MHKYEHGGDVYQGDAPRIDFSININPLGMPPAAVEAIVSRTAEDVCYPDPHCRALTAAVESHFSLPHGQALCGSGSADLIFRLCAVLQPRDTLVTAPTEMENVKKLGDFYSAISEYADRNYIYPEDTKVSKYYRVKYHCSMLHVGYIGNKEPEFFCARQELDDESKYIDIEDIIDNKKQAHVPIIEKSLNQLDKRIIKLHEDGIPGEAIELSLKKTLIKLRENKN